MKIDFKPDTHEYFVEGIKYPSVTEILADLGLYNFSGVDKEILEKAGRFGKAVHKTCELYDMNDLDHTVLSPELEPYLSAWVKFKKDTGFEIDTIEENLASIKYGYAGTLDRTGKIRRCKVLLDIKTPEIISKVTALQTAGYAILHNEKYPKDKIKKRYAIQLKGNGHWLPIHYKDFNDEGTFLACLKLWKYKKKYNL